MQYRNGFTVRIVKFLFQWLKVQIPLICYFYSNKGSACKTDNEIFTEFLPSLPSYLNFHARCIKAQQYANINTINNLGVVVMYQLRSVVTFLV